MFKEQYRRLKEIGCGAFGSAYLVQRRDTKDVFHVAKTIKLPHLSEEEQETAQQEARYLQQLSHPNIIAYVACLLEERRLHIIMEYADRGDLAAKILRRREEQRPFSESSVMRYFVQIAQALEHIHAHQLLHRDIKPQNIFLAGPEEQVKVGDFGVARVIDQSRAAHTQIGTPHYMSPEVINTEGYGTKSELWSLGVVAYELMALHVPFKAPSLPGIALQIVGATPEPLPTRYAAALRCTTMSLLEKEPQQRPTLKELLRSPRSGGSSSNAWAHEVKHALQKLQQSADAIPSKALPEEASSRARVRPTSAPQESHSCASSRPSSAPQTARSSAGERNPAASRQIRSNSLAGASSVASEGALCGPAGMPSNRRRSSTPAGTVLAVDSRKRSATKAENALVQRANRPSERMVFCGA